MNYQPSGEKNVPVILSPGVLSPTFIKVVFALKEQKFNGNSVIHNIANSLTPDVY